MTSVFTIVEVSGNSLIVLPVMILNTIAYLICCSFQRTPIFDLVSQQDRVGLPSTGEQREEAVPCVEDATISWPPIGEADRGDLARRGRWEQGSCAAKRTVSSAALLGFWCCSTAR